MEIGKKIKQLRLNKGVTQETLANALGVTYQAVSRWENETTMPDISLLPQISVFFGVSIDELFEFTEESQYERIENMLNEKSILSDSEFQNTKYFLEKQLNQKNENVNAIKLLAWLYSHRAKSSNVQAVEYAKRALQLGDTSKSMNNILRDAYGSPHTDWNYRNRHELIEFYYEHLKIHSDDMRAYRYLLPALIADGRTDEARELIKNIRNKEKPELLYVFDAMILRREGKTNESESLLDDMLKQFPDSWYTWSIVADFKADDCEYEDAISCFEKSFELQEKPRFTDSLEAIAHIYEIKKDYQKSISTYQRIIELLETDWNITFGTTVNKYLQKIDELKIKK
ncbi:MAG: helix-turn-helix domain-containing protein [Ruminococcaceae bacterium]|nr:helix-turn-helix domain-containing protein [Oscillospiraceae bacterium]